MKDVTSGLLNDLWRRFPDLVICQESIVSAFGLLRAAYAGGGKVLICGNGGSAADAEHIAGELMKGFLLKRPLPESSRARLVSAYGPDGAYLADHLQGALPAISLASHPALSLAFGNDVAPDMIFAQQVLGYGQPGDLLIALSTSGNSANVVNAAKIARVFGLRVLGLTGAGGGRLQELCDVTIQVPARETYLVQEFHLPVYHTLCAMIEQEMFDEF